MDTMPTLPPVRLIGFVARQDVRDGEAVGRRIAERLRTLAAGGARVLARCSLTGPADLLFAREAARLGLPLSFLLPAEGEKVDFTEAEREEAARLAAAADEAEECATARGPGSAVILGERLVAETDDLIAVTRRDGDRAAAELEEIIAYARNRGRPILLIEEAAGKVESREVKAGVDEDAAGPDDARLARLFGDAPPPAAVPAELERYFHACDDEAARKAPQVRSYLLNIVLANATASLAGSVREEISVIFGIASGTGP